MKHIYEGLEKGDLKRLVTPEVHVDEYESKMGRDEDVCVISFKVTGKEPALDLVNFIEKGYDWVIDADVSSGEMPDGDFVVFVECERNHEIPENLYAMIADIVRLTEQDVDEWKFKYHKSHQYHQADADSFKKVVPLSSSDYKRKYGKDDIDKLKAAAGVKVDTKAPKNDLTDSLRRAAGIL